MGPALHGPMPDLTAIDVFDNMKTVVVTGRTGSDAIFHGRFVDCGARPSAARCDLSAEGHDGKNDRFCPVLPDARTRGRTSPPSRRCPPSPHGCRQDPVWPGSNESNAKIIAS